VRSVRRPAHAAAATVRRGALGRALLVALLAALHGVATAAPAADPDASSTTPPDASPAIPRDADTAAAASAGRTVLQRVDLSGAPGMEVVTSLLELKPGERLPRHVHHGVETAYVLQGATILAPGRAPRMLSAGSTAVHLRGVPHGGFTVVGDTPLKLLTTHVVDKGKPLYDAAPAEARSEAPRADPGPDAPR
jgi:quercetin dioxygenase-like cupin family protein